MKKVLLLTMVLGLAALPADLMGLSSGNIAAADNIPHAVSLVLSVDGSVCIVYIEITDMDRSCPVAASVRADIIQQLPDVTTLVLLGFGGLLYRRRKE
mgnify:CR=1 FL=1